MNKVVTARPLLPLCVCTASDIPPIAHPLAAAFIAQTGTPSPDQGHTHTRSMHARARTHARTHAHTHTYTHTNTHAHTYTLIHKHRNTHTNSHTHIHTHTHTHARRILHSTPPPSDGTTSALLFGAPMTTMLRQSAPHNLTKLMLNRTRARAQRSYWMSLMGGCA
jgi:hypothetical protein